VKVAVIGSPGDEQTILSILEALASAEVDAYGLKIHDNWTALSRSQLESHLLKASHYLLVATELNAGSAWFAFAGGYGLGRASGTAIFRDDPSRALPRYLAGTPVLDTLPELAGYYAAERDEWDLQEARRLARSALLEMGISYHADALAQCVMEGDTKAVELFLDAGFLPDARDRHGVTLLCLAARNRHRSIAQLLLDRGASVDLASEDRGYTPLMDAALVGSPELLDLFLSAGADVDAVSKDGQTALIVAVGRNDAETVRKLLAHGADPDIADKLGLSARKYAALFRKPDIAPQFETLAERGRREEKR